ncbi:hypothetical protein P3G55_10015 [Leptospira sp. 96542]|nr:hypothetical protein [Leptospira sp. 96542]
MITSLMMLLGLSRTGDELQKVGNSGSETGGDGQLSARQKRRRQTQNPNPNEETGSRRTRDKDEKELPEPKWGGRGKEMPFQTDKKESGKEPRPLSEKLDPLDFGPPDSEPKPESRARRKKNETPKSLADLPLGDFGEDSSDDGGSQSASRPKRQNPDVSFTADEIISKNSKYSFHRRPLLNAEALVENDQVEEAIEIFERTGNRIPDGEIRNKIQKNIQDLEEYLEDNPPAPKEGQKKETDTAEKKKRDSKQDHKLQDPNFKPEPKLDRDLSDLVGALKEVSDLFAESIARAIQFAQSHPPATSPNLDPGLQLPESRPPQNGNQGSAQSANLTAPQPNFQNAPPTPQNIGQQGIVHPVVYQFLQSAPQNQNVDAQGLQNQNQLLGSLNQGLVQGSLPGAPGVPMSPPGSGIVGPFYVPQGKAGEARGEPSVSLEDLKEEIRNRDISELDLPEETFFGREWKGFKDLPLVDRRSGEERRKNQDRRSNVAGRKDRRSGEDRRKSDRFKEREDFLKNKAVEKLEHKAKQLKEMGEEASLNDLLKPYFPDSPSPKLNIPELDDLREPIGLPEAEEIRRDRKPPVSEDEWLDSKEDPEWFDKTTNALRKELELPEPIDPKTDEIISKPFEPPKQKSETVIETDDPIQVELTPFGRVEDIKIGLPDADEVFRERQSGEKETGGYKEPGSSPNLEDAEPPEIEIVDGDLGEISDEEAPLSADEMAEKTEDAEPEKIIHGVLELKPPEADDAPFLTLTYDFGKIPHAFRLSKNYSIMEYSYFKYKPMLMKAQEFARRKMLKNALNYYRVIKSQNIPPELRKMINRNIRDITEFMEKFLMAKGN